MPESPRTVAFAPSPSGAQNRATAPAGGARDAIEMRWLTDNVRLRLLLAAMAVLQAAFLVVRARPYGAAAHGLLALLIGLGTAAAVVVALLPERIGARLFTVVESGAATRGRAVVVLVLCTGLAGVASVLTQQVYSWDESSVMWAADVVASGGARELLARYGENAWLGPQHPPLVPLLYGTVTTVFGSHLKLLRLVNLAFGCGTVVVAFLIFERLYQRRVAFVAALLLLTAPLFVRVASAATNDMPLTFLFCLAILLALCLERSERGLVALALGVVIGLGLLVKYTMVLVFPVLLALAWQLGRQPVARRHAPVVLAVALAMLLAWLDHAYALGILEQQGTRLGRLARVSWRAPGWSMDAILTKTPSAIGVYMLPLLALGAVAAWRRRTVEDGVVLWWIALVFVPLLLTLPDNRYFLPAFPALALLMAHALVERPRWAAPVLVLAAVLCALTLAFYARIDLAQQMFLFRGQMS